MNVLSLTDVSYNYTGYTKQILRNASMDFEAGKVYTIAGKSGSGKSTLLALIAGLDTCKSGDITHGGQSLKTMNRDRYRARGIGVIFQSYNLLTNATAAENIVLSMNISGSDVKDKKAYAYELLESIGIDRETAGRKILKMSGGEQQRVGIARALAHNPEIIIADEPTGNLDRDTEDEILDIFVKLAHEQGKCVIIVTHSRRVTKVADVTMGIRDGELVPMRA